MYTIETLIIELAELDQPHSTPIYLRDKNGFETPFTVSVEDNQILLIPVEAEE
jgi:hypothetical protein